MQGLVREAMQAGAAGFASSFSPNHSGWGGQPMPSTIAGDEELKQLVGVLKEAGKGIFVMATGPRGTPEFMEAIAADTGRPAFMVTVLTMYSKANPERALQYYERCAAAIARGHEVYIHTSCQPLSFDFTLREPYILYSHDAFDRVKAAAPEERAAHLPGSSFPEALAGKLQEPESRESCSTATGRRWSRMACRVHPARRQGSAGLRLRPAARHAAGGEAVPERRPGVAPLLKHPAGVVALSDAGAHLIYFCDAGFGLHFLAHWVRETRHLHAGGGRAAPDQRSGAQVPHPGARPDRAGILGGPAAVRPGEGRHYRSWSSVADLPGGGTRMIRKPRGVHGVWVNGLRVFDGEKYIRRQSGPGR